MVAATSNRLLLRAAARIHDCLATAGRDAVPTLPLAAWQELETTHARLKLAVQRHWPSAAAQLRRELEHSVSYLIRRLDECLHDDPTRENQSSISSAHDVYRDLVSL